jgi:hypothetical protein
VTGTRVVGSGASTVIPQTGIQYSAGARGAVTGSEIANNRYSTDLRQSVGLLLTDSASGADPQNTAIPAFSATGDSFTGNGYAAFNASAANDAVRLGAPAAIGGWFGCAAGPLVGAPSSFAGGTNGCQGLSGDDAASTPAPSITLGTVATAAPAALAVPAAQPDAKPTGRFATGDYTIGIGGTFSPLVQAADDFGVKKVSLLVDGTVVGTTTVAPVRVGAQLDADQPRRRDAHADRAGHRLGGAGHDDRADDADRDRRRLPGAVGRRRQLGGR